MKHGKNIKPRQSNQIDQLHICKKTNWLMIHWEMVLVNMIENFPSDIFFCKKKMFGLRNTFESELLWNRSDKAFQKVVSKRKELYLYHFHSSSRTILCCGFLIVSAKVSSRKLLSYLTLSPPPAEWKI